MKRNNVKKVKVRLNNNITDEQFVDATFGRWAEESDYGIYDINRMKTEDLDSKTNGKLLNVDVIRFDGRERHCNYEGKKKNIWEIVK